MKLKVLVFSRTPWRTDNSFGNTYSNWFAKMESAEVAHICLADGLPMRENNVSRYYQVSENKLAKSIFKRKEVGCEVYAPESIEVTKKDKKKDSSTWGRLIDYCKVHRLSLFFLLREFIWKFGRINYTGMKSFIKDYNPDVVFMPMYYAGYVDRVAMKALEGLNIPIVLEAAIDVYSLKQISFDPFYWVNRFYVRRKTRQISKRAQLLYVISERQKRDYGRFFNLPVKVMYKFPDLDRMKFEYKASSDPVKYLYTGNLGLGRWKSISSLAKALHEEGGGTLDIYTQTRLTEEQKSLLNIDSVSTLHSPISQKQVIEEQNKADVLVHVESFNLKNKLAVRYSISTKIMDYISSGRCILAIGPSGIASLDYLSENNLAAMAYSESEVKSQVRKLNSNHALIKEIADNNVIFLHNTLDEKSQREKFKADLESIVKAACK